MYKFKDLSIDRSYTPESLPVEALNYGGHWLDYEINGFETLVTKGRQEFTRQINTAQRSGDGDTYLSSRLEARKIEVTFVLKSSTIDEYNERLSKLRQLLFQPNQPFYFADKQDYHFIGTVTGITLDKDTLNTTGKITLEANDPYQYGNEKHITGSGNNINVIDEALTYPQTPKYLTFTPSSPVANLVIECNGKSIKLSVGVSAGQPVFIDFDNLNVSINHVDSLMNVMLDSNLSDFLIQNGSAITSNVSGNYDLTYEVKTL